MNVIYRERHLIGSQHANQEVKLLTDDVSIVIDCYYQQLLAQHASNHHEIRSGSPLSQMLVSEWFSIQGNVTL